MARSAAECAQDRAAAREAEARQLLAAGRSRDALWVALKGIAGEVKKLRDRRLGDGLLTDADLTGVLLHIAAGLHEHRPARPRGCRGVPGPDDLLAVLDDSLRRAAEGEAG